MEVDGELHSLSDRRSGALNKFDYDIVFIGAGLANCLAAIRLKEKKPDLKLLVIDRKETLFESQTWSFHHNDLCDADRAWIRPFVTKVWPEHSVIFPSYRRSIRCPYYSVRGEEFRTKVSGILADNLRLGIKVDSLSAQDVHIDGQEIKTRCVVDGRGWEEHPSLPQAYQKFLGLQIELDAPLLDDRPLLKDVTVEQRDGYRFMYVLPWTTTTLLVEDTYYSNNSDLNLDALRKGIVHYCDARDWRIKKVLSEEVGRLPIPLGGHPPHRRYSFPVSGVRGGLFHPTTSYSFAKAVHFANFLCVMPEYHAESLLFYARNYAERHWRGGSFFRFLNRMMFQAATPHLRYRILERFYRLPASLIQHFYSGQMTLSEKARLLLGRPPVPVLSALDCLLFTPKRIRGVGRIIPRFGESR